MILNRQIAPPVKRVESLRFPDYQTIITKGDVPLYALCAGTQAVIRLDFVFDAGLVQQVYNAQSAFTASMLSEGTSKRSAPELADSLDFFGSYFQARSNADDAVASLYCLEKHLENCLPLFLEALFDSVFPVKELEIQKKNSIQKLLVNERKNSYLCRKNFYKNVFGAEHPYSAFSEKENIEKINRNCLEEFHQKNFINGLKYILLSGNFQAKSLSFIESSTTFLKSGKNNNPASNLPAISSKTGKAFVEKNDSVQSALRIGKISIDRNHPDFRKLQFLNLIFGGYFGSRLMKNIREEKGLTYGIYSVLEPFQQAAVWYIDSDINSKNREIGIKEIYKEMSLIRELPVPEEELEIARNYYLGSFQRSLDGPFSLADRLKIMIDNKLPNSYYPEMVSVLNNITSTDLQEIAQKYFGEENLVEMVVGKK